MLAALPRDEQLRQGRCVSMTRSRASSVELPEPPGPVRMYFCGPTVYQRIHVGNARPFVFAMWLRALAAAHGYDVHARRTTSRTSTTRSTTPRPAKSAELARDATEWYLEDTGGLGLGRPDLEPKATETIPEIVALIEELVDAGFAYEVDGDVYFRVARFPEYGRLSGQRPDKVEEQEPNPRKEDPRDFALWKANKPGEDTSWDSPWGEGRPGWHIECSAMAEKLLGPAFEIHGGGLDLVFPHHENELAQSRALGREFARIWMHNGMLRFGGEEMSKSLGNVVTLRDALDDVGERDAAPLLHDRPLAQADRLHGRDARSRRRRGREGFRDVFRGAVGAGARRLLGALCRCSRRRLQHARGARDHARVARPRPAPAGARDLRARVARRAARGAAGGRSSSARAARRARAEQRLRRCRRAARGIEEAGWVVRDVDAGFQLVPRRDREQVYGRRPVREALRGRREVLELWATERALAAEPWLRENGKRVQVKQERELSEAAGTRDHQGVVAWVEPYKYADAYELAARRAR